MVRKIRNRVSDLGELIHVEVIIRSAGGEWDNSDDLDVIAFDILPHPLSLLQSFIQGGLPDSGWNVVHNRSGEIRCNAPVHGMTAGFVISMSGRPPICSLSIVGTNGAFYADLFHGSAYFEPGSTSRSMKILRPFTSSLRSLGSLSVNFLGRIIRWQPAYPGMRELIAEFYDSIKGRSKKSNSC